MTVGLFSFVSIYDRALATARRLLDKGVAHAAGLGITEGEMLDWRLIEDMQPLRFQLMVVCNYTRRWPARVADLPLPGEIGQDLTVAQFEEEIAGTRTWLSHLEASQFEGRDEAPLTVALGTGLEPTAPAQTWMTGFATINVQFHLHMTYAILRAHGVPLGKADLFPLGL